MCDPLVLTMAHDKFIRRHMRSSHHAVTHVRNKNINIQVRSPNVVKVILHTMTKCSKRNEIAPRKEFAPSGGKFFPLREVPVSKRDAIEENHGLIQ